MTCIAVIYSLNRKSQISRQNSVERDFHLKVPRHGSVGSYPGFTGLSRNAI